MFWFYNENYEHDYTIVKKCTKGFFAQKTKQGKVECLPCLSDDCSTACTTFEYMHDEANNAYSDGRCDTDCECDGLRVCSPSNYCINTARPIDWYDHPDWYIRV